MTCEIYSCLLLIGIGALVGISMSFMGQTGQGIVIPVVLLLTSDALLAISISVLNDLITAAAVSTGYVRKKEYLIRKDLVLLVIIAVAGSFIGIYILMTSDLKSLYGWFLPVFIIVFGSSVLKAGFPTSQTIKELVGKTLKILRKKQYPVDSIENNDKHDEADEDGQDIEMNASLSIEPLKNNTTESLISHGSKLFYLLAVAFGFYVGINSGMFGANSGMILMLAMVIIYGYTLKKSVGTALLVSIVICTITFIFYQVLGVLITGRVYVDLSISLNLAIGAIISGLITSRYIQKLSAKAMGRGVGAIMVILGTISLLFYLI
ncbi:MAG: sulfite exporter TauE/SafE family protein [Promethearchaeota archaeon]